MRKNLGIYFQDKPIQILEHLNSFDFFQSSKYANNNFYHKINHD